MPIPDLDGSYLPPGEHDASLEEVEAQFGSSSMKRIRLHVSLRNTIAELRALGVTDIWIGGSFISDKRRPDDVDIVYDPPAGSDLDGWGLLAPARRQHLKEARGVDLLWSIDVVHFFKTDSENRPRGVIRIREE